MLGRVLVGFSLAAWCCDCARLARSSLLISVMGFIQERCLYNVGTPLTVHYVESSYVVHDLEDMRTYVLNYVVSGHRSCVV